MGKDKSLDPVYNPGSLTSLQKEKLTDAEEASCSLSLPHVAWSRHRPLVRTQRSQPSGRTALAEAEWSPNC
jgi:hypothetical protein